MPPKPINWGGCLQRHLRPSCLQVKSRGLVIKPIATILSQTEPPVGLSSKMATGFSDADGLRLFGEDWKKGTLPKRGTEDYLEYLGKTLTDKEEECSQSISYAKTVDTEQKLRRLSLSPLPASHTGYGQSTTGDQQAELSGVSTLSDRLSKLHPEFYCDPPKSYEKLGFSELIRGGVKVLTFLRASNINVDGYLSHLGSCWTKPP